MRSARHRDLTRYNRAFYERCWRAGTVVPMPGVATRADAPAMQLEVGCGLRPRLPLTGTIFVDVSRTACTKLGRAGARALCAGVDALPLRAASVTAVHAYDLLEHLDDDTAAIRELTRVIAPGGVLVLSTPLHAGRWQEFDRVVGHARRYEPRGLLELVGSRGFVLEAFARFGLRPRSRLLNLLGVYYLTRWPRLALRFEERVLRARRRADTRCAVRAGDATAFLSEAADMDGVVTVWRRRGRDAAEARSAHPRAGELGHG